MTTPPDAPYFEYIDGVLNADGVSLETLAKQYDTPTYVYNGRAIDDAFDAVARGAALVGARSILIAYAVKANGNLAVLRRLAARGCGADIVSGGELARALRAGILPGRIVFSGVGKRDEELIAALDAGIRAIHVESEAELHTLAEIAKQRGGVASIALRVNPNVDAATHPYIATGLHDTKFGLEVPTARRLLPYIVQSPHLTLEGVACHIGSQLETVAPLREAVGLLANFAETCRQAGAPVRSIDVGGGWPMHYGAEGSAFPSHEAFGHAIADGLGDAGADVGTYDLITEPGRALVGAAGALLSRVVFVKEHNVDGHGDKNGDVANEEEERTGKRFVIVDAAMTELIRPALYSAYHTILPVKAPADDAVTQPADIVGPVCESGDFLAQDRPLPPLQRGDLVAILGAGAYGREMAMTYNARPLAAEILCERGTATVARKRASVESLWLGEE